MIVAIDGPAGSGKTTTARRVAESIGFVHIDTGAMYRAATLQALNDGIDIADDDALVDLSHRVHIELKQEPGDTTKQVVLLNGEDVTAAIRTPQVDLLVSRVSEVAGVRTEIVNQQRVMAASIDVVMEGRDIGTVVFPNADVKVYLVASLKERSRRRQKELALRGISMPIAEVLADLERRDQHDSTRAVAPLKPAPDAVWLDTTELTIDRQIQEVIARVRAKQQESRHQ
jgi:CMP/dCMP kinase